MPDTASRKKIIMGLFSSIMIILLVLLVLLTSYTYYTSRSAILNIVSMQNLHLSEQSNNFTEQFYQMVRNYVNNVFYSRSITQLRTSSDIDNFDYIKCMRDLRTYASSTDYIHSIYVYNGNMKYIYSTLDADVNEGSNYTEHFFDKDAVKLMLDKNTKSPVIRTISVNGLDNVDVISFAIYAYNNDTNQVNSSMIINISLSWLENFITSLIGLETTAIYSTDGSHVLGGETASKVFSDAGYEYMQKMFNANEASKYFLYDFNGQKYICFHTYNSRLDWHFLQAIPYDTCLHDALALRNNLIIFIVCIAVIGFFVGVLLTRKLYSPVDKLLDSFSNDALEAPISSFEDVVEVATEKMKNYTQLMRTEYLRQLLLFNRSDGGFDKNLKQHKIELSADKPMDIYITVGGECHEIDTTVKMETVQLNGQSVWLVQGTYDREKFLSDLSGSATFCACAYDITFATLNNTYMRLQEIYRLRIFLPKTKCFTLDVLEGRENSSYPKRIELRIISALHSGNGDKAAQLLCEFIDTIAETSTYSSIYSHLEHLYRSLVQLDASDMYSKMDVGIFFMMNFSACQNINDLHQLYRTLFKHIAEQYRQEREYQRMQMVQRAKQYINDNYIDPGLSVNSIAERENVSVEYLSDIFKATELLPISKYIVQVRLKKAKELLLGTDISVNEIAHMVGFSNQQYFYTLFKSKFNMTPNHFREDNQRQSLANIESTD